MTSAPPPPSAPPADRSAATGPVPAVPAPGAWWLGVDFGTSNTTAAVMGADGISQPVQLDSVSTAMPSAVVLMGDGFRVGRAAENAQLRYASTFERSPKKLLGQGPMTFGDRTVLPEELAAEVLREVRERARRLYDGRPPQRVVLTHPAEWGPTRLEALRRAAGLAGFDPATTSYAPEPLAALWHLAARTAPAPGSRVAVFDFGGGTCDIAVLERPSHDIADGYRVLGVDGDEHLGGDDIDDLLRDLVLQRLEEAGRSDVLEALRAPAGVGARLTLRRTVCDHKEELSSFPYTDVPVSAGGHEAAVSVTSEEFEQLIDPLLQSAESLVRRAIDDTGASVSAIYLTGGASRTRPVAELLRRVTGLVPMTNEDPKLVVAMGALRAPLGRAVAAPPAPVSPAAPPPPVSPAAPPPVVRTPPPPGPRPSAPTAPAPAPTVPAAPASTAPASTAQAPAYSASTARASTAPASTAPASTAQAPAHPASAYPAPASASSAPARPTVARVGVGIAGGLYLVAGIFMFVLFGQFAAGAGDLVLGAFALQALCVAGAHTALVLTGFPDRTTLGRALYAPAAGLLALDALLFLAFQNWWVDAVLLALVIPVTVFAGVRATGYPLLVRWLPAVHATLVFLLDLVTFQASWAQALMAVGTLLVGGGLIALALAAFRDGTDAARPTGAHPTRV